MPDPTDTEQLTNTEADFLWRAICLAALRAVGCEVVG